MYSYAFVKLQITTFKLSLIMYQSQKSRSGGGPSGGARRQQVRRVRLQRRVHRHVVAHAPENHHVARAASRVRSCRAFISSWSSTERRLEGRRSRRGGRAARRGRRRRAEQRLELRQVLRHHQFLRESNLCLLVCRQRKEANFLHAKQRVNIC